MVTTRYHIIRSPCLMEDEGRHFYIKTCKTKKEAKDWIAAQKEEYFKPGDYYITEEHIGRLRSKRSNLKGGT